MDVHLLMSSARPMMDLQETVFLVTHRLLLVMESALNDVL